MVPGQERREGLRSSSQPARIADPTNGTTKFIVHVEKFIVHVEKLIVRG
jgi:hypothetical protein